MFVLVAARFEPEKMTQADSGKPFLTTEVGYLYSGWKIGSLKKSGAYFMAPLSLQGQGLRALTAWFKQ